MKRFYTFLLLYFTVVQISLAVVAYPGQVNYRQPDGSFVKVHLMGDEDFHWAVSEDGYTLMADAEGFMTLAMPDKEGNLLASKFRMVNVAERSPLLLSAMGKVQKNAQFSPQQLLTASTKAKARRMSPRHANTTDVAVMGSRKFLVILMQFPDKPFQKTNEDFNRLLNEEGYSLGGNSGSVHDFYKENSFGQLDLQCDVAGIYTAEQNMAYYGNNTNGNAQKLAVEALTAASKTYDLKSYDTDGDGYIDGVHIIFAGYGEEAGGGSDCIWSHESWTSGSFCDIDGLKMSKYSCTPELSGSTGVVMSKIGVICHEIGHALGTMDFYDTDYSTSGQYPGTGMWDVMGSGNWNNGGATPAHFNPYSKIYDFHWTDAINGNKAQDVTLKAKTKGNFVRIDTKTEGEFFLLEYRDKTGFDASLPGHGLMVYRSSGGMSRMSSDQLNAMHPQQFYPVCANATDAVPTSTPSSYGTLNSASAPFPGTLGKTEFTDDTTPSMKSWDDHETGFPVTNIYENTADESVSFLISNGNYMAYDFNATNTDYTVNKLTWSIDNVNTVMLAYNITDTFGTPETKDYKVGDEFAGGGKIIYVGTGTEFVHSGLSDGKNYYYRLYSKSMKGDGWKTPLTATVHTKTQSIREFPYTEDFEFGELDGGWSQEFVQGQCKWTVQKAFNRTSHVLYYSCENMSDKQCATRVVMPPFNFHGHQNAMMEFDFRNLVQDMRVVYRSSKTSEWKLLTVLESSYKASGMTNTYAYNSEQHIAFSLPDISDSYEVAFVADERSSSNVRSSYEVGTIDNIEVNVDFGAFTVTRNPTIIGDTYADIPFSCFNGTESITSRGIEWSHDQSSWTKVASSTDNGTVRLTSLPSKTKIYYRSYVTTKTKTYYGNTLSFFTIAEGKGTGTADDPITITNETEWNDFVADVDKGNDMTGVYYLLCDNITVYADGISGTFSGHLDGGGHTITITKDQGITLINTLGEDGVIENLNVTCERYIPKGKIYTPFTMYNYGLITKCDVNIESLYLKNSPHTAGMAGKNYGTISYCHSYINLPKEQMYTNLYSSSPNQATVGGICWYNMGLIDHCSFDGDMTGNNNSTLGGIAANNWYETAEVRGRIINCINRGNMHIVLVDGKSWASEIGGIAGTNYGRVEYCINEGKMTSESNSSDVSEGGVTGWNCGKSTMRHCLNRGPIEIEALNNEAGTGGVTGFNDMCLLECCVNTGEITVIGTRAQNCNSVIGWHREDKAFNYYYSTDFTDAQATKITSWDKTIQTLNDVDGAKIWYMKDGAPHLAWEDGIEIEWVILNTISQIYSTYIQGTFACSGNIKECGIRYRKSGTTEWNIINYTPDAHAIKFTIDNLQPKTEYEIGTFMFMESGETKYTETQFITTDFDKTGTADDPILISSTSDMRTFAKITQQGNRMDGRHLRLAKNLNMHASEGEVWTDAIDIFNGEFDGGGHYIYNMKCVIDSATYAGVLFTYGSSYIHDLHLYDVDMEITFPAQNTFEIGTIVGICDSIVRCSCVGKIKFTYKAGSYYAHSAVGGIVGCANKFVRDCYALVTFESNLSYGHGGIAGHGYAKGCYYGITSSQTAQTLPRGIVGNTSCSIVGVENKAENCYFLQSAVLSNYVSGTPLSLEQMKDGTLLSYLYAVSPGTWDSSIGGNKLDGGYPVLSSQRAFPDANEETGISETTIQDHRDSYTYNLSGQRVSSYTKGIIIKNGKKVINR